MKRKILAAIGGALLLVGLCVLLYPTAAKLVTTRQLNKAAEDFMASSYVGELPSTADRSVYNTAASEEEGNTNETNTYETVLSREQSQRLYRDFCSYNQSLVAQGQSSYGDPFLYEDESVDLYSYGIGDSAVGVLSIPKIDLLLPVYLGAGEYNMSRGAAQLNRTSLPIGGKNTNCVIAGHTGMASAVMFDNIVKLEVNDEVFITNFWEILSYRVKETKIIDPNGWEEILIKDGEDLVTLVTCYPYGSNTHRYLVICERI